MDKSVYSHIKLIVSVFVYSGVGRGGSMHVGPNDPRFFPSNPFPAPFGGPGSVPPGGRYDPIGPPDVPGFEQSRFVRRPRHPGGSTHPDREFQTPEILSPTHLCPTLSE